MRRAIYLDSFSSADDKDGRGRYIYKTYEAVKRKVLEAGRFSCFEATERPGIYTQLCHDAEIETLHEKDGFGYPWVGVRLKQAPSSEGRDPVEARSE